MKNVNRLIFNLTLALLTACSGGVSEGAGAPAGGSGLLWIQTLNQSLLLLDNLRALATAF